MEITLNLQNKEDIAFIDAIPEDQLELTLQRLITLGRVVMTSSSVQFNLTQSITPFFQEFKNQLEMSKKMVDNIENKVGDIKTEVKRSIDNQYQNQNMILPQITHQLSSLTSEIEKLTNIRSTSNLKGKVGEELICQNFQQVFPEWEIENVSQQGHEGDFIYHTSFGKVLLEIKTYSTAVNKDQIQKLYNDIDRHNYPYALMLSTTSGIVGKKAFDVEKYKETTIVYVSNAGLNGQGGILGMLYLQSLCQLQKSQKVKIYDFDLEKTVRIMENEIISMNRLLDMMTKIKYNTMEMKKKMNEHMDEVYKSLFEMEIECKQILKNVSYLLYSEMKKDMVEVECWNNDAIVEWIQTFKKTDKRYGLYQKLYDMLSCNGYQMSIDEMNWTIYKNNEIMGRVQYYKTKIELLLKLEPMKKKMNKIEYYPDYETINQSEINIKLSLNDDLWTHIHKRLENL